MADISLATFKTGTFTNGDRVLDPISGLPRWKGVKDAGGDRLGELDATVGEISDGDRGDINVTGSGLVWDIKPGVVGNTELDQVLPGGPTVVTNANITIDTDGRITAAASGAGGGALPTTIANVAAIAGLGRGDLGSDVVDLLTFSDETNGRGGSDLEFTDTLGTGDGVLTFTDVDGKLWRRRVDSYEPEMFGAFVNGSGQPNQADCSVAFQKFLNAWQNGDRPGYVNGGQYNIGNTQIINVANNNDLTFGKDSILAVAYTNDIRAIQITGNPIRLLGSIRIRVHKLLSNGALYPTSGIRPKWTTTIPLGRWTNDDVVRTAVCTTNDNGIYLDGMAANGDAWFSAENFGVGVHFNSTGANGMQLSTYHLENIADNKVNCLVSSTYLGGTQGFVNQCKFIFHGQCSIRNHAVEAATSQYAVVQCSNSNGDTWYGGNSNSYDFHAADMVTLTAPSAGHEYVGWLGDGALASFCDGMRTESTPDTRNQDPATVGQRYGGKHVYRDTAAENARETKFTHYGIFATKVFEGNGYPQEVTQVDEVRNNVDMYEEFVFKNNMYYSGGRRMAIPGFHFWQKNDGEDSTSLLMTQTFSDEGSTLTSNVPASNQRAISFDIILPKTYDFGCMLILQRAAVGQGRLSLIPYDANGDNIDITLTSTEMVRSHNASFPMNKVSDGTLGLHRYSDPFVNVNRDMVFGIHQDVKKLKVCISDVDRMSRVIIEIKGCAGAYISHPTPTGLVDDIPLKGDYQVGQIIRKSDATDLQVTTAGALATQWVTSASSTDGEWIHNNPGTSGAGYGIYESDGTGHGATEPSHSSGTVGGLTYLGQRPTIAILGERLWTTGVSPNSYTSADITVDSFGRITTAANGSPGADTSITAGTLAAAAGSRIVDMAGNHLTFDSANLFTIESNAVEIKDPEGLASTAVRLYDDANTEYVGHRAPANVTPSSYHITWAAAPPGTSGFLVTMSDAGVISYTDPASIGGGADTSLTAGTLATATTPRVANFGNQTLNFDALGTFEINATSVGLKGAGQTPLRLFNTSNTQYVGLRAPSSVTGSYNVTFASTPPVGISQLLLMDTAGTITYVDPASINETHTGEVTGATALTITADAVTTTKILNNAVTLTKIAQVTGPTTLGRETGTGDVLELTPTQIRTIINVEDNSDQTDTANVVSSLNNAALTAVTVATGDLVIIQDASDSKNIKTVTAQSIADLAGSGSNILTGNQTQGAFDRIHDFSSRDQTWNDLNEWTVAGGIFNFTATNSVNAITPFIAISSQATNAPGEIRFFESLDVDATPNFVGIKGPSSLVDDYTIALPDALPGVGVEGALVVDENGLATFVDITTFGGGGSDTSLTAGTLATATTPRSADFGNQTLSMTNAASMTLASNAGVSVTTVGSFVGIHDTSGGTIRFYDDNDTNYAAITVPTDVTTSYTVTLPAAGPTTNNVLTAVDGAGTMGWVTPANIVSGSLGNASGPRTVNLNSNALTFSNVTTLSIDASAIDFTGSGDLNLKAAGVGQAAINLWDEDNTHYVGHRAVTDVTQSYDIRWAATPPTGSKLVTMTNTAGEGVISYTDPASFVTNPLTSQLNAGANTIYFTQQTATGDGTTTIDWTAGNKFAFTFGAFNETFAFSPAPGGPTNLLLKMTQDGTGSRTATWPATVKWAGGVAPTLSTAGGAIDVISFYFDGTNYFGAASLAFA